MDGRVDVVLPCLDEAAALRWVLPRVPAWARPIVVDNGSTDGSADVARELGATVGSSSMIRTRAVTLGASTMAPIIATRRADRRHSSPEFTEL